jgi:ABC-type lipoprotein release transport system permease subunit
MGAITIGVFGGLAATGIMKGMVKDMLNNTINTNVSHIQVHEKNYLENNEIDKYISASSDFLKKIEDNAMVKAASARTKTFGMASTASKGAGVMINGVNPDLEQHVTTIHNQLVDSLSHYFESPKKNRIIVSQKIANDLNLKLKSKVVITFQDLNGNLTGASFKVEGIYKTHNSIYDAGNVFVKKKDLDRLLNMPENTAHEVAVLLHHHQETEAVCTDITKIRPDLDVKGWYDIDPYLEMTASMTEFMLLIFMTIIMLALGFAIVNTMLMVILERTRELGMIMSIGMNRYKIFLMIMFETGFLTVVGAIVGMLVSALFTWHYGIAGLDISSVGEGFESVGYSSIMYPLLEQIDYIEVSILVVVTSIIASIFPSIRALKMKPAEAVRE